MTKVPIRSGRLAILAMAVTFATGNAAAQDLSSLPKPNADQIARLGSALTPMGSETAGNASGTIPQWTGGITSAPSGYQPGDHHPDPFGADQPMFTISPANLDQYADNLTVGQKAMFARYPGYAMKVYPTRRSASFKQSVYDATIANAPTSGLTADGEGVTNASFGFPFPFPTTAQHLIWNHKLKYKGHKVQRYANRVLVTAGGDFTTIKLREELLGPYYQEGKNIEDIENILAYFFQAVEAPARVAGNVLLVHETANQVEAKRQAWIYNPGQRRVRRAPNIAYDNPATAADGLSTNDMTDMFNGAMDRYDWELVGKKEMYIPYNAYKLHQKGLKESEVIQPGHINPELGRYELHRVWVVDAKLKDGMRHQMARRTFYLDEDSYQIVAIDHYDARGDLWRHSEGHVINYYDVPTTWTTLEVHHDLTSGRYLVNGFDNNEDMYDFNFETAEANYTPQALRRSGKR